MKGIDFMEFLAQESEIKEIRMEMLGFMSPGEFLKKIEAQQNNNVGDQQIRVGAAWGGHAGGIRPQQQRIHFPQNNIRRDLEAQEFQEGLMF